MKEIKFYHHIEVDTVYTGYKVSFDGREIYLVAWQGKRFIETTAYEVNEFESNFEKGVWIKRD